MSKVCQLFCYYLVILITQERVLRKSTSIHFINLAKSCSVQPKIYNSSCEEKESKLAGIAGFYSDETSEETDPRPGYIKNSHLIKGYRSSIIEAVKPRRIKAEGRLAKALQRLVTGKRKGNISWT